VETHTHTTIYYFTALLDFVRDYQGDQQHKGKTRKAKPIWFTWARVSGSGISWAKCKPAPWHRAGRHITMPASLHWVFYRPNVLPATQPTVSKHWRHSITIMYKVTENQANLKSSVQQPTTGGDLPFHQQIWTLFNI